MPLSNRKRFVAGLMTGLLACMTLGNQNRTTGPVEFSLRSVDGQTVSSASLRGEVVVLAFGASWLPLSKTQLQGVRPACSSWVPNPLVGRSLAQRFSDYRFSRCSQSGWPGQCRPAESPLRDEVTDWDASPPRAVERPPAYPLVRFGMTFGVDRNVPESVRLAARKQLSVLQSRKS
jgi:hypothetical protein